MNPKTTFIFVGNAPHDQVAALKMKGIDVKSVGSLHEAKQLAKGLKGPAAIAVVPETLVTPFGRKDIFELLPPGMAFHLPNPCALACELDPDNNQPFTNTPLPPGLQAITGLTGPAVATYKNSAIARIESFDGKKQLGGLLMVREFGAKMDVWYWNNKPWPGKFRITLPVTDDNIPLTGTAIAFEHKVFGPYVPPPSGVTRSYAIARTKRGGKFAHMKLSNGSQVSHWWASQSALSDQELDLHHNETFFFSPPPAQHPPPYWKSLTAGSPA